MKAENKYCKQCDAWISKFEKVIENPVKGESRTYYTGVDLGTAHVVLAVLDENFEPVAGAYRSAKVVRDGIVVDYIGALQIVRELKKQLEEELETELIYAAAAIPPGTEHIDGGAVKNVVEGAGFEVISILDEPTAANIVLGVEDGAVVDIGGGTTGIAIFKNGQVSHVVDEPTGGTHFSLVIAGAYQMEMDEADQFKRNEKNHKELMPVVKPVMERVASILKDTLKGQDVKEVYLAGGTCCFTGIETVIEKYLGIPTYKPVNPMFVTPLGIALSCRDAIEK